LPSLVMFMSSNHRLHPNANAGHGHRHGQPLPKHQYAPPANHKNIRQYSGQTMAPFAGRGRANNSHLGDTNLYDYPGAGAAAQKNLNQFNNSMRPPSSQAALSHFNVGPHSSSGHGRRDNGPMYSRNNHGSIVQMNRANEFNQNAPFNGWNASQQQQHHHQQQQQKQQQQHHYRHQDYPNHSYNKKPASRAPYSNNSYNMPNNNNSHARPNYSGNEQQKQQQHRSAAAPPPPPPLPEDYSKNRKRSRWDNHGGDVSTISRVVAREISREKRDALRKDPPKREASREISRENREALRKDPPKRELSRDISRERRDASRKDPPKREVSREASRENREASRKDPPKREVSRDISRERRDASRKDPPKREVSREASRENREASRKDPPKREVPREISKDKMDVSRKNPSKPGTKWDDRGTSGEDPSKPQVSPPAPNKPMEPILSKKPMADNPLNAINALSKLENKWSGSGGAKGEEVMTKSNKRAENRRRRRIAQNNTKNGCIGGSSSSNHSVEFRDLEEKLGAKIDVEDGPSSKKQKSDGGKEFDLVSDRVEVIDLVSNPNNFPPLASKPPGVALEKNSALQPTSVPGNGTADQTSTIQYGLSIGDDDEEMDISDEEKEAVDNSKANGEKQQKPDKAVDLTENNVADLIGAALDSHTLSKVASDTAVQQTPEQRGLDQIEKEKHALKLAELKAKAKLARAKLRIAEKKKARGIVQGHGSSQNNDRIASTSHRPVSTSPPLPLRVRDITVGSLVICDVAVTGPPDEVRFVESVYRLTSRDEQDPVQITKINSISNQLAPASITVPLSVGMSRSEEKRIKLKQQLQLARLQLETKKKELLKRKALSPATEEKAKPNQHTPTLSTVRDGNQHPKEQNKIRDGNCTVEQQELDTVSVSEANELNTQGDVSNKNKNNEAAAANDALLEDTTHAKLERLRHRQKELKQKNDVANSTTSRSSQLQNLIHRQQDLLRVQGQELSESTMQFQSCVDAITSKQNLLKESDQRLMEMHHRKRIVDGMVIRATEQLILARKVLRERRHQNNV